jgi:predicted phosphodiesterase
MLICMTGDMCDGANIYPTQLYEQAIPNARDQALIGGDVLAELFDSLRPYYGDIRVAIVAGNHGLVKYAPDSQNHDVVLADQLAQNLAGKIPVLYRAHEPWLLRVEVVSGLYALLYHGHKKLGKTRVTAEKDIARWATIGQFSPFHYVLCGHYHYREYWEFNGIHFFRTGTMLSDDPYSRELGYESSVAGTLFGVNIAKPDTRRVTFVYPVDLT